MRTRAAARVGAAVGTLSRRIGVGSGGVIGGRVTLGLDPSALAALAAGHRCALVSGTNGKTTTTRLLSAALGTVGPVATNLGGANLPPGIVTALSGSPAGAPAALEVDEAWLGRVATAAHPAVVCLLNLSRDQLDRISEVRMLAGRWRDAVAALPGATVVANCDDPMVAWAARGAAAVVWVAAGMSWRLDAAGCPECEGRIEFAGAEWSCSCGLARPRPDVWLEGDEVVTADGRRLALDLSLPGRCNRANAAVAVTACGLMGVDPGDAVAAMRSVSGVAGRYSVVSVGGVAARLLLAKNPAGWAEVFDDLLRPAPAPVVVAINARIADGRDPSWLWDVPFERLAGRLVVATGERCRDLAVRLHYAEVEHRTIEDLAAALVAAGGDGPVDVVANYTPFQQLRRLADGA